MESLLDVVLAGEDKERPGESARRSLVPGKEQHRNLLAELAILKVPAIRRILDGDES